MTNEHPQQQGPTSGRRFLRLPYVKHATGLCRSTIYEKIKRGEFPAPVSLGPRAVAWLSDEISAWIDARVAASRQTTGGR